MDTSRIRQGEMIAAVAAVILFVVMFFGWFGVDIESVTGLSQGEIEAAGEAFSDVDNAADSFKANAWESFGFIDIILLITIIAAVALAAISASATKVNLPVALSAVVAGLGILSTLLVLYRIIDTPFGFGREFGVFLGLVATAAIAYGGWRAMQEEGTSFQGEADRLQSDRPGPGTGPGPGAGAPPPPPPSSSG